MFRLHQHWILDVLDVLLVAFLFYRLFLRVKGTRAAQMFASLIFILLVSLLAQYLQLNALNWIFNTLKTVWVVAFVVIFQPELRGALAQLGQVPLLSQLFRVGRRSVLDEVARACEQLTERGWGALLVLERDVGLMNFVETGSRLDAMVKSELLVTIFTPGSPLHDGAVMISGDTLVSAGCILPLSQNIPPIPRLGMRHRAALGLAEETDAVVVVVSEERREVSLAVNGELRRGLSVPGLRSALQGLLARRRLRRWRRWWRAGSRREHGAAAAGS
ncbi:MAG TPA: diadenylate cyclase CdaA [Candidatus Saccharimonadales bacterium]|nr:diadenylate cyclase CdaA [Candidatus Saccharimonadales bacterium]